MKAGFTSSYVVLKDLRPLLLPLQLWDKIQDKDTDEDLDFSQSYTDISWLELLIERKHIWHTENNNKI